MVHRDYIPDEEVADLLQDPWISQVVKDVLTSPLATRELAKTPHPPPQLMGRV
jgi:hypothetical protein